MGDVSDDLQHIDFGSTPSTMRYPIVECVVPDDELDLASADFYDLGTVGIEELGHNDDAGTTALRVGFPSEELARAAESAVDPAWNARFRFFVGDDWLDAWREHFEPFRAGNIVIVPTWKDEAELLGHPILLAMGYPDITLHLDPGRSFGTGAHPSTRMILEAVQANGGGSLGPLKGKRVLDIGCGSGVLAVAALLLEADQAHGIDIETAAPEVTMVNAHNNAVGSRCSAATTAVEDVSETYDVVFANILAPVLIELGPAIQRTVGPNGKLYLSGLIDEQKDRVLNAYPELELVDEHRDASWVCLVLARPSDA